MISQGVSGSFNWSSVCYRAAQTALCALAMLLCVLSYNHAVGRFDAGPVKAWPPTLGHLAVVALLLQNAFKTETGQRRSFGFLPLLLFLLRTLAVCAVIDLAFSAWAEAVVLLCVGGEDLVAEVSSRVVDLVIFLALARVFWPAFLRGTALAAVSPAEPSVHVVQNPRPREA